MVIAATPFSPSNSIMMLLNRNVVIAVVSLLTISEDPLKQLSLITAHFNFGFVKDSVPLLRAKYASPTTVGIR